MSDQTRVPSYRRHKATGQAVVTIGGKDHYLGKHGTAASRREYNRLIAEWLSSGHIASEDLTVTQLISAYWKHVKGYYVKNGKPTSEVLSRLVRSGCKWTSRKRACR